MSHRDRRSRKIFSAFAENMAVSRQPDGTWPCCNAIIRRPKGILETSSANETSYSVAGLTPKILPEGCTYVAQGDNANAQKLFEQARPAFEAAVKEAAESGWLYALVSRKNDSIAEG
jgi:hypothetical protein